MKELIFYRCTLCNHPVSPWDIEKGGCQHCGGTRIRPSNLSVWERIVQVVKHPKVWEWGKVTAGQDGEASV